MSHTIPEIQALANAQGITLDPCLLVDYPLGTWFWAIHHTIIAEPLTESLANRLHYILTKKPQYERRVRLAALRPMIGEPTAKWINVNAELNKANAECAKASTKCSLELLPQWNAEYPDHPVWRDFGLVFKGEYKIWRFALN